MNVGELKYGTQAIKSASPIARVVSQYVRLQKSGPQMIGLCPFHKEKTPSLTVHPTKGLFKCFGCGEGGDVFRFVQLIEGVDFKHGRAILAERAGISTAERYLTREEKREYGRKINLAEHEADDLLCWAHVVDFDRRISVLKNADFARLLPLFRARKTGRKAVAA
jgi:hypothetical protein